MRFDDQLRRALEGAARTRYAIGNPRAGDDALGPVDVAIAHGRIERVAPAGSIVGAIAGGGRIALRCTHAHGTGALRTHLDSTPGQDELSWRIFDRVRERWRGELHQDEPASS
jgi:hypothetical protein